MKDDDKSAHAIRMWENMWWLAPLLLALFLVPQIIFVWSYFGTGGWLFVFPFLSALGSPLFVAVSLSAVSSSLLLCAYHYLRYTRLKMPVPSKKIVLQVTSIVTVAIVVLAQVELAAKLLPTLWLGYMTIESLLRVLFDKPSLGILANSKAELSRRERTFYELSLMTIMMSLALLNVYVAYYFPTGTWVIWKVTMPYALIILLPTTIFLLGFLHWKLQEPA